MDSAKAQAVRNTLAPRIRRLRRELAIDLRLAFKEIVRRRRRSAVAVSAVAFGVVALLLAAGFIQWIFWALREATIHSGLGHVQITRPGYGESGLADPLAYLLPDGSPFMSAAEAAPGVRTLAPRLTFYGMISLGDATLSFQGEGLRPEREGPLSTSVIYGAGEPLPANATGDEVLLGQGLAENLGAKPGDRVVLLVSTPRGGINAVEARVRGFFSTVTKAYDDVAVRVPLALAQRLLRVEGSTRWILILSDTEATPAAVEALRSGLPADQFTVTAWESLADFYNKTVQLFSRQVAVLQIIIVVIVVLAISNSMTTAVLERTGEIGTALALGATPRTVLRRFLVEGFALGLIGTGIGLALGLAAAAAISKVGIPMPPPPGMTRAYLGEIRVTPGLAAQAMLLSLASSVLAAILPAWRASRMTIVDAIRRGR